MPEQRIVITIDEEGGISAKTGGFKGDCCLEALEGLLALEGRVASLKKTDEYYQQQTLSQRRKVDLTRR